MSKENIAFSDYFKGQNSDDEEKYSDLQSRLYAEIYYAPHTSEKSSDNENLNKIVCVNDNALPTNVIMQNEVIAQNDLKQCHTAVQESLDKDIEQKMEEEELSTSNVLCNNAEPETRYSVLDKQEKQTLLVTHNSTDIQKTGVDNESDEGTTDDNSDSDESILEVPIPPKPKPPLINLQESDEDSRDLDDNSDNVTHSRLSVQNLKDSSVSEIEKGNAESFQIDAITNDIILNCTQIQRNSFNIRDIREISKATYREKSTHTLEEIRKHCTPKKAIHETQKNDKKNLKNCQVFDSSRSKTNVQIQNNKVSRENVTKAQECVVQMEGILETNATPDKSMKDTHSSNNETVSKGNTLPRNDQLSISRKRTREAKNNTGSNIKRANYSSTSKDSSTNKDGSTKYTSKKNNKGSVERAQNKALFESASVNAEASCSNNHNSGINITTSNSSTSEIHLGLTEIQSKMSKDPRLWAILDEDLMPCPTKRPRLYNVRCHHCHHHGHLRQDCPKPRKPPKCHMCGIQGHSETRCPQKMCLTCGKTQNTYRKTCESCRTFYCELCNAVGHKSTECPDHWRKYHQTTKTSEVNIPKNLTNVMKPANLLVCCNCTKRGHDSSTCNEYRWSQHFPTPAFVSSYTNNPTCINENIGSNPTTSFPSTNYETCSNEYPQSFGDFIPLVTSQTSNSKTIDITQANASACRIIYSYGTPQKGPVKCRNLSMNKNVKLTGVLDGRITPTFLEWMSNLFQFHVQIYTNAEKEVVVSVAGSHNSTHTLMRILIAWLSLQDDEKDRWLPVNLPLNRVQLLSLFKTKLEELKNVRGDPIHIWKTIQRLKKTLNSCPNKNKDWNKIKNCLLQYQIELVMIVNTKPENSTWVKQYKRSINALKSIKDINISIPMYLTALLRYSRLFAPYTPNNLSSYMQAFKKNKETMEKCKVTPKNQDGSKRSKSKRNVLKQKELDSNPFHHSSVQLQNIESSREPVQSADSMNNTNTLALDNKIQNDISIQNKYQCTENLINIQITHSDETTLPSANDFSVNSATNEAVNEAHKTDVISKGDNSHSTASSNICNNESNSENIVFIDLVEQEEKEQLKFSSQEQDDQKNDNSNIRITRSNNTKKNSITNCSAKKKKKKQKIKTKAKSCKKNEKNIILKAKQLISNAYKFKLPHMNAAAKKIQKRINENNIGTQHILTLEKLIALEKSHRDYVNSCCQNLI